MEPDPHPARRSQAAWFAGLVLLAWWVAIAQGGFAYDDREALVDNPIVQGGLPWWRAFLRDYWLHREAAGHWRPVAALSLALDYSWSGLTPWGYHLTNVLLHAGVLLSAAAFLQCIDAVPARKASFVLAALALVACHPAQADVVAWISGRTSSLAALFALTALLLATRLRSAPTLVAVSAIGTFLSVASKEDGLALIGAGGLALAWTSRRRSLFFALGALLGIVAAGWLRALALGQAFPHAPHAPLAEVALAERMEASGRALAATLRLAAAPRVHAPTLDSQVWRAEGDLFVPWGAWCAYGISLALGAITFLRADSRWRRLVGASVACACLAYFPHLQVIPSGELYAPRFLYLPLLLGLPALAELLSRLPRWLPLVLVGFYLSATWPQSQVYSSRAAYWQAVLNETPTDARAWNALGNAARETGDLDRAERAYQKACSLRPRYSRPWNNLGTLALEQGRHEQAQRLLEEALRHGPRNPVAWGNLGVAALRAGRPADAAAAYQRATELSPGRAALWRGLARAHWESGAPKEAHEALERALALDPEDGGSLALKARMQETR